MNQPNCAELAAFQVIEFILSLDEGNEITVSSGF
jgi:hypothetical protein